MAETERFPNFELQEIQELLENTENKNTKKGTSTWLNVWTTWAESKEFDSNLLAYEPKQLDQTLQKFFAEIRKQDGSEYEPDSLRLREEGYGKRPKAAKALTSQDEELLWSKGLLGDHSPKSLISTMWFFLTQQFGLRGCQEHHDMYVEDFTFTKDDNGVDYITYEESPTKTRQGGLRKKRRVVQPKMFATGGERCPVKLFKTFLS